MVEKSDSFSPESGLSDNTPLGARIGRVQVAVRPIDPVLMERIGERFREISEKGIEVPKGASLAIRSVDGFYYVPTIGSLSTDDLARVVSIVNYDPVRRTFILSGSGMVDDLCELFWYAFEAFPSDTMIFHDGGSEEEIRAPDQMDARVSFNISRLHMWKEQEIMVENSRVFWRGRTLNGLMEFLIERYG